MVLSIWAYEISAINLNPKGPGSQISLKSGPWFSSDLTVGELMTAVAGAMQAYIKEERMLKSVRAA